MKAATAYLWQQRIDWIAQDDEEIILLTHEIDKKAITLYFKLNNIGQ